jgi:hypothetical protein
VWAITGSWQGKKEAIGLLELEVAVIMSRGEKK